MKSQNNRIILCVIFIVICFFLQGCSKNLSATLQENQPEVKAYNKTITDLHITPDYVPKTNFIQMTDSLCYFGQETIIEQDEEFLYNCKFYSQTLDGEGEPTFILEITESVQAFHLSQNASGEDMLSILTRVPGKSVLTEYSGKGTVLNQFEITDNIFVEVNNIVACDNGFYIAYGEKLLFVIDEKGKVCSPLECPGEYFQSSIEMENGKVYVTYLLNHDSYVAEVNLKSVTIGDAFILPSKGRPVGQNTDGTILVMDNDTLYRVDPASGKAMNVLELLVYNLFMPNVRIVDGSDSAIRILSWENGNENAPIRLEFLTLKNQEQLEQEKKKIQTEDSDKYDVAGKRIITLYDPSGAGEFLVDSVMINRFNQENEKYTLVMESGNKNIEAVLAAEDSPDLMFSIDSTLVENYQENGYLEDLYPYLEKSEMLKKKDIQEGVLKSFTYDGGLYALPEYCTLNSLFCLKSQVGNRTSWTVDEFLHWIENEQVKGVFGITKKWVLEYCLLGNLKSYVDFESGTAKLTSEKFKELLSRIKELKTNPKDNDYTQLEEYDMDGAHLFNIYVSSAEEIAYISKLHGEEVVNMGFPNDAGEENVIMECVTNYSILSKSDCKEGAFEFIEYCLTYKYDDPSTAQGHFWSAKSRLQKEWDANLEFRFYEDKEGEWETYSISQDGKDMLMDSLDIAEADTYEKKLIREIIHEEVQPYFQDQKDLNTVCDIIQSRVSILLSERR